MPSPSFAIIEIYDPPAVRLPLVHADFYRLKRPEEAEELGLDDYRADAVLIAEWPENGGDFAAEAGCLSIELEVGPVTVGPVTVGSGRMAIARAGSDWLGRTPWT